MWKAKNMMVYVGIVVAMICWSLSFIWYKDVYHFLSPFITVFFRLLISSTLLFGAAIITGSLQKVNGKDFRLFFLLALSEPFLYFVGESMGMLYVTPTVAAVMVAIIPLMVPVFAFLVLKEQINRKNVFGIFISFIGVMLVILDNEFRLTASLKGVLFMGLAVISAVVYSIVLRKLAKHYNPLTLIAYQNAIGAFMFLPLTLIFEYHSYALIDFKGGMWVPLLNLSIFASSVAFLLYSLGVQRIGAFKANIFTNTIPVFTALFSYFLMGESLNGRNFLGIFLVVGGLVLSQLKSLSIKKNSSNLKA